MPRRSRLKIQSPEARALKRLREIRELSLRELAKVIGVSATLVNHTENGRVTITKEYLDKFLLGLDFSREDFKNILQGKDSDEERRAECVASLRRMPPSKLELIYKMIVSI